MPNGTKAGLKISGNRSYESFWFKLPSLCTKQVRREVQQREVQSSVKHGVGDLVKTDEL